MPSNNDTIKDAFNKALDKLYNPDDPTDNREEIADLISKQATKFSEKIARRRGLPYEDALDIAQIATMEMIKKCNLGQIDVEKNNGTLLHTIVNRRTIDLLRSRSNPRAQHGVSQVALRRADQNYPYHQDFSDVADDREPPTARLETQEADDTLKKAISQLPKGQREVMEMKIDDPGLNTAEIARRLDINCTTVYDRLGAARKRLRNILSREDHQTDRSR